MKRYLQMLLIWLVIFLPATWFIIVSQISSHVPPPDFRCFCNLQNIEAAKAEYALEYGGTNGMLFTWDNIGVYIKNYSNRCVCMEAPKDERIYSNNYLINPLGVPPVCTVVGDAGGHTLNEDARSQFLQSRRMKKRLKNAGMLILAALVAGLLSWALVPRRRESR